MKKFYIADILTFLEFVAAAVIVYFAFTGASADYTLFAFVFGEVCDAFDGICARRWHYPDDGKKRWWREHAALIDVLSDLLIGIVTLVYTTWRCNTVLGLVILIPSVSIGVICQIIIQCLAVNGKSAVADKIAIIRRHLYIAGIATTAVVLLLFTPWSSTIRDIFFVMGTWLGVFLWLIKKNRRTENHTKL